uniref:Uncharacterized protein n=1 Tax=Candidatus Kentrum sp. TUN TaxID=2126343 RepID=A0A450ZQ16_9GAMM|nr:MAG: hypothetical protein BECKTUN1418D_GA0071000_103818 [Candidatus Kentron sp. TUN]
MEDPQQLLNKISTGRSILFTGAGFSIGTKNSSSGFSVPGGFGSAFFFVP